MQKLRHEWLLHFFLVTTNFLPDNVMFIRFRGRLVGWCLGSCGKRFGIGRNVTLYQAAKIYVGNDVYIAYGAWLNGAGKITIEDEVLIGPYSVLASSNHQFDRIRESFRFAPSASSPILIGRGSWLCSHVTITAGVEVKGPSLIAANSVVANTTTGFTIVGGVPGKELKEI